MRTIISIISVNLCLLTFLSCNKKFDHSPYVETDNPTSCELCDYADSISGFYKGNYNSYQISPANDSIVVELEHIFLSLSPKIDSTKMFFKMTEHFNNGNTSVKTVSLDNHNGQFYNTSYGNKMYLDGDSLHYEEGYSHKMGFTKIFFFDGKKL